MGSAFVAIAVRSAKLRIPSVIVDKAASVRTDTPASRKETNIYRRDIVAECGFCDSGRLDQFFGQMKAQRRRNHTPRQSPTHRIQSDYY
jgi:hypothetical protein